MAYNDLKTVVNGTFTTAASAASSDLAGVVAGADVLATQFDSLKSTVEALSTVLNQLVNGQFTVLADSVSASGVTASEGQLYFETDTNTLSVYDGAVWSVVSPTGVINAFGGASAPSGWLLCDGAEYSQSTYAALYGVLSTSYNTGSETAGYFRVPDLRGRVAVGKGTHSDVDALTKSDGITPANAANRSPLHKHTYSFTATSGGVDHYHGFTRPYYAPYEVTGTGANSYTVDNSSRGYGGTKADNTGGASAYLHTHPVSGSVGVGAGTSDTMAYLVTNYIIKV